MTSQGCEGKLHCEKLFSAGYAENYIRVAVTSRGISGCWSRSVAAVSPPPPPPSAVPTLYTYHVYLPVILTIFFLIHRRFILLTCRIFYLFIYLLCYIIFYVILYYVILYYIILYFILFYFNNSKSANVVQKARCCA